MPDYTEPETLVDTPIPKTDEEVIIWIKKTYSDLTARNLIGIYQCRRGKGETLLDAYQHTLEIYIKICNQIKNERNANTH